MHGRKRGASQGEKEGGGKEREGGVQVPPGGRLGLRRQAGGGEAIGPAQDTQELASWRKKTMKILQKTP
jgi:hypothetical protein